MECLESSRNNGRHDNNNKRIIQWKYKLCKTRVGTISRNLSTLQKVYDKDVVCHKSCLISLPSF